MKHLLIFLAIILVGSGVALSLVGVPAPTSEVRIPIAINVKDQK